MNLPSPVPSADQSCNWAPLVERFERTKTFVISSHIHPDGDAIGSALALRRMLENYGKDAICYFTHPAGRQLEPFCKPGEILLHGKDEIDLSDRDLVVMVDASGWDRLGVAGDVLEQHPAANVCIDHHPEVGEFPGLRIVDTNASSTTVLIYRLLKYMQLPLTQDIAEAIYLGMIVDTINFHLPNTNAETHRIAADCIEAGVKPDDVYEPVFGTMRFSRMRLMAEAFSKASVLFDGVVGTMYTDLEMVKQCQSDEDDDDGFSDLSRNIEGVKVGIYFRQTAEDRVKVSWRTKEPYSIVESARKFGGGGHLRAAGAMIHASMDEAKNLVLADMEARVKAGDYA